MAQAGASGGPGSRRSLAAEIARQMARLLVLLVVADLVIRRGSAGVRGLRLYSEHPILSSWTTFGDRAGLWPRDSLLIGSLLMVACLLPVLLRVRRPIAALVAAGCTALCVQALLHRIAPDLSGPPSSLLCAALAALAAAGLARPSTVRRQLALVLAAAGVALGSAWMAGVGGGLSQPFLYALELGAEAAVLTGLATAHLLAIRTGTCCPRLGWAVWLIGVGLVWWVFSTWTDASIHVTRHLFSLGQAGMPVWVLAGLLGLGCGSLLRMITSGGSSRGDALVLFLALCCVRGPGEELVALRLATVVLIAARPLAPAGSWAAADSLDPEGMKPAQSRI